MEPANKGYDLFPYMAMLAERASQGDPSVPLKVFFVT